MKSTLFILLCILTLSTDVVAQESNDTGKIYFMRAADSQGIFGFNLFVNEEFTCRLGMREYAVHEVPAGTHSYSIRFNGRQLGKNTEKFEVVVKPGETVYLSVIYEEFRFDNRLYCDELVEHSAKKKMQHMTKAADCNTVTSKK